MSQAMSCSVVEPGILFIFLLGSILPPGNCGPKKQQKQGLNWVEARRPSQGQS